MAAAAAAAAQCSSTVQQHSSIITVCVHEIELLQVRVWESCYRLGCGVTCSQQYTHRMYTV